MRFRPSLGLGFGKDCILYLLVDYCFCAIYCSISCVPEIACDFEYLLPLLLPTWK
jgi:hypothetical protein